MVFLQYLYNYVLSISSSGLFLMMMMMMMMNTLVFAAGPTGLSLKLFHRDSLYPRNLTKLERMERAIQRTIHREQRLISTFQHQMKQEVSSRNNSTTTNNNSISDINTIRPEVKPYDEAVYIVELGIGTFASAGGSPILYNFFLDTGSDLLWLQCDATRTGTTKGTEYFEQDAKMFNRGEDSLTYNPLPYNSSNHICQKYVDEGVPAEGQGGNFCGYQMEYLDGGSTEGVLATEKLTVRTDNGGTEEINDFVFGCGYRQDEPFFGKEEGEHPVAGILGLGGGDESFIRQLGDRVDNKFEICLKPAYEEDDHPDTHTFLRFGSDTKIAAGGRGVQSTFTFHARGDTYYYVIMNGISINGRPVLYPSGSNVFTAKQDGTGGVVLDSGSEFTVLSKEVYVPFRDQLVTWFSTTHGIRRRSPKGQLSEYELCFKGPDGFDEFPSITFRFNGGDFEMEPDAVFAVDGPMFCLTMLQSKERYPLSLMVGAIHLANHRILHDLGQKEISWVSENCAINP